MSKLPNIFHNNGKFITNNKNSYNTFKNNIVESKNKEILIDIDSLINYFNKRVKVTLKSGEEITGILISKRNNYILLDNSSYIKIKDIISIK